MRHAQSLQTWENGCSRRRARLLLIAMIGTLMWHPEPACAVIQFQKVFLSEYIEEHPDEEFAKFAKRKARCYVCHQGKGNKHNNVYGEQLARLLDHKEDKKNDAKITAALRKVGELPLDPSDPKSETFAQRIAASKLPAGELEDLKKPWGVPLFDGKSLAGWMGATDAYEVREGVLTSVPGQSGNLYTESEHADFVLLFEFRLTPGANNGIGIRTPSKGDAAYMGIELQVLDNTAEKYADLKPYQFHGSAYGIAPAERGHLKPVGEWNSQEIRCEGSKIEVVLNKHVILDIDLDEVAPNGKAIDGKEHAGLSRKTGHIGLLGHGDVVEYRKFEIQDLSPEKKLGSSMAEEKKFKGERTE
ncbi:3-keto-disaccharide hydrolase [Adhaeretor mobilis]|uniref:3-keto-alpha-glucoside-1,2-lyase/3-keto-2-hydroxy-glucal hydratase domain-containing protein n=1 Tax=Adhaeretor mobilis TaxID=1930276 RepID=A0A517MWC3_9BACT|nr:DUF1080 domain-containing protein [Adhaeretor mobilis]QDS99168.1 hypothetical protein HG15A2_24600 [Adhaeretor mobilis]